MLADCVSTVPGIHPIPRTTHNTAPITLVCFVTRVSVNGLDHPTFGGPSNINSHRLGGFRNHHQLLDLNEPRLIRRPAASRGTRRPCTSHARIHGNDID